MRLREQSLARAYAFFNGGDWKNAVTVLAKRKNDPHRNEGRFLFVVKQ